MRWTSGHTPFATNMHASLDCIESIVKTSRSLSPTDPTRFDFSNKARSVAILLVGVLELVLPSNCRP